MVRQTHSWIDRGMGERTAFTLIQLGLTRTLVHIGNCKWINHLWLLHQSRSDRADGDTSTDGPAIFKHADLLDISLEQSARHPGRLAPVSTQILWLTALCDAVPMDWLDVAVQGIQLGSFLAFVLFQCTHYSNSLLNNDLRRRTGSSRRPMMLIWYRAPKNGEG